MSFFGFDASLPGKGAPDEESALNDKIERALAASAQEDVEVYTWGQDTYDGLGDQLQETNDDLNEDTFGTFAQDVGKDFDFGHGQPQAAQGKSDRNASAFAASFDDFWSTPALSVDVPKPEPERAPAPRPATLDEVEAELRTQRAPPPAPPAGRPLTLEEVEAELRSQRPAPVPSAPVQPAPVPSMPVAATAAAAAAAATTPPVPPPAASAPPAGMPLVRPAAPPAAAPAAPVPPPNPQAAHLARMRAMLEACPQAVQQAILSLPPPIQFDSLEEVGARFPALLVPGNASTSEEQAAIQLLLSTAPSRMQQWQAAEEKRRAKAAKLAQITRYNGIMSGSDKDFITRIQISHLVTPDPYTDDFYAHVFFAVRGGGRRIPLPDASTVEAIEQHKSEDKKGPRRKLTRHENAMLRMQQQVERLVDSRKKREAKGSATGLEGTLGRVSLSSANKPRQILQVIHAKGSHEAQSDAKPGAAEDAMRAALQGASLDDASLRTHGTQKRESLSRRESLVILEQLYAIVLRLEQLRREPALDADLDAMREQKQLTDKLWDELRVLEPLDVSDPHPFVSLLNHVKGKRLLPRALRLLDPEQGLATLTMLIASFSSLDAVRNYAPWEQYQALEALPHARAPLTATHAAEIGRSIDAFGNSVLFNMISLINQAPLRIVSGMLALLMERNDIVFCAKTRPGVSVLTVLLSRAETLRQAASAAVPIGEATPSADEVEQWSNVFGVLLDRLAAHGQLAQLFPSTRVQAALPFGVDVYLAHASRKEGSRFSIDAEDEPVWNLMALFAIHSDLNQQQVLVQELREKILANIIAANEAKSKGAKQEEDVRIRNVNLLLHALNLDAAQITL